MRTESSTFLLLHEWCQNNRPWCNERSPQASPAMLRVPLGTALMGPGGPGLGGLHKDAGGSPAAEPRCPPRARE